MPFLPCCSRLLQHCSAVRFKHALTELAHLFQNLLGLQESQPCSSPGSRCCCFSCSPETVVEEDLSMPEKAVHGPQEKMLGGARGLFMGHLP